MYFPGLYKLNIMDFIIEEISNTCFRLWRMIIDSLDVIPAVSSDFERSYLYILCYTYAT